MGNILTEEGASLNEICVEIINDCSSSKFWLSAFVVFATCMKWRGVSEIIFSIKFGSEYLQQMLLRKFNFDLCLSSWPFAPTEV